MLTQLSTVKTRLNVTDTSADTILTNAIAAVSERFDRECNRTFARQTDVVEEFGADALEICPAAWPIESVSGFDLKTNEATGWQAISPTPDFLVRNHCVISLECASGSRFQQARVTYTGGYVLPGTTPDAGQTPLPSDIEQACVEQLAYWFQNRADVGLADLLPSVAGVLSKYTRMNFAE
jgi:hypothetical protein